VVSAERRTAFVAGTVQGVGFRWWVRARALELGVVGWALNRSDGRVEVVAEGPPDAVEALMERLDPRWRADGDQPERPGRVDRVVVHVGPARGLGAGFVER
jgi:acylphosphatase